MTFGPPASSRRLFEHYPEGVPDPGSHSDFLIGRLLEEGDSSDLRWLLAAFPEERISAWLALHGGRQLSRRSLSFWELLLGRPTRPFPFDLRDLWPL